MGPRVALVFGASGISGWAIVRECLSYPSSDTFSRVIGLTNRPLAKEALLLPNDDRRVELYDGMDLSLGVDYVVEKLKGIKGIEEVSHVYYTSYAGHGSSFQILRTINTSLLSTAVQVLNALCPALEFFTLQTGGKAYGVEFVGQPGIEYNPPLEESAPRIPEPYASNIFYYSQYDELARLNAGQKWGFCEIRPDVIVGFTPQGNAMNFAQAVAIWLSLVRDIEGESSEVPFPGNEKAWKARHTDSSQDVLARSHIHLSLKGGESVNGKSFNIADGNTVTWEHVWPGLCEYFKLKGVGPSAESVANGAEWVQRQKQRWGHWERKHGLKQGYVEKSTWEFMNGIFGIGFDRQYDLSASRGAGFKDSVETPKGYHIAFDRMRESKIIP